MWQLGGVGLGGWGGEWGRERKISRLTLCCFHHFLLGEASHKAWSDIKDEALDCTSWWELLQKYITKGSDTKRGGGLGQFCSLPRCTDKDLLLDQTLVGLLWVLFSTRPCPGLCPWLLSLARILRSSSGRTPPSSISNQIPCSPPLKPSQ